MAKLDIESLVESGVHFGHRVSRWNPKMEKFIYGKRNLIHIIDLVETVRGVVRAARFVRNVVAAGHQVVIVGTKRQIRNVVLTEAQRCNMPYVNERWLGGTLTNFTTVRSRLKRLDKLEDLENTGKMLELPKKSQSFLTRELTRIRRNLDGIRHMERLPGAMIVIDTRKEYIAVNEANRLGIPIVAILDTDCDPTKVDFPIPGNDDAMRSVQALLGPLVDSICEGKANARELAEEERKAMTPGGPEIQSVRHGQHRGVTGIPAALREPGPKKAEPAAAPADKPAAEEKPAAASSDSSAEGEKPSAEAAPSS